MKKTSQHVPPDSEDGSFASEDPMDLDDAESLVKKTLVLIDFNGMLVLKDKHGAVTNPSLRYFVGGTGKGRVKFYLRPGVEQLIARLASDSRCKFAIYTSMMRHNITPFFQMFDESQCATFEPIECDGSSVCTSASLVRNMWKLFDQGFNTPDPQPGDPYAFKRNLSKIWQQEVVSRSGFSWRNTLLVEGEELKSRDWVRNTLQPREFTVQDAMRQDGGGDATLARLGDDLDYIFTAMQNPGATIPAILTQMRSLPPAPPASVPTAPPPPAAAPVPAAPPPRAAAPVPAAPPPAPVPTAPPPAAAAPVRTALPPPAAVPVPTAPPPARGTKGKRTTRDVHRFAKSLKALITEEEKRRYTLEDDAEDSYEQLTNEVHRELALEPKRNKLLTLQRVLDLLHNKQQVPTDLWKLAGFERLPRQKDVERAITVCRSAHVADGTWGLDKDTEVRRQQARGATVADASAASQPVADTPTDRRSTPLTDASLLEVDRLKALGNDAFAAKKYEESILHYTIAIQLDKLNHILYSNRSAAYASLGNFDMALSDARRCVQLSRTWEKGHLRMGVALQGLEKFDEAIAAYRLAGSGSQVSTLIASAEWGLKIQSVTIEENVGRNNIEVEEAKRRSGQARLVALNNVMDLLRGKREVPDDLWIFAGFSGPVHQKDVERSIVNHKAAMEDDIYGKWQGPAEPYRAPLFEGPPAPPQPQSNSCPLEVRLIGKKTWITGAMQHGIPLADVRSAFPRCVVKSHTIEVPGDEVMAAVDLLSLTVPLSSIDVVNNDNPKLVMKASLLFVRNESGELCVREDIDLCSSDDEEEAEEDRTKRHSHRKSRRRIKMLGFYVFRTRKHSRK